MVPPAFVVVETRLRSVGGEVADLEVARSCRNSLVHTSVCAVELDIVLVIEFERTKASQVEFAVVVPYATQPERVDGYLKCLPVGGYVRLNDIVPPLFVGTCSAV